MKYLLVMIVTGGSFTNGFKAGSSALSGTGEESEEVCKPDVLGSESSPTVESAC